MANSNYFLIFAVLIVIQLSCVESMDITSDEYLKELQGEGVNFDNKLNNKLNVAYFTPWNKEGIEYAKLYAKKIDILSPVWFDLKPEIIDKKYNTMIDGSNYIDKVVIDEYRKSNPKGLIIPRFACSGFNGDSLNLMMSEKNSEKLISALVKRVKFSKFDGVSLDCSQFWYSEDLYPLYTTFQRNLYTALNQIGKKLIITMFPYSEAMTVNIITKVRFEYLNRYSDYTVLMIYDYIHYFKKENPNDTVVKNTPQPWIQETIDFYSDSKTMDKVLPKMIIGTSFHGFIMDKSDPKGLKGNILDNKKLLEIFENEKSLELNWNPKDKEYSAQINTKQNQYVAVMPSALSFQHLVKLINNLNVAGLSIWELGQGFKSWMDEI